jgi:hypothetical protein
MNDDYLKSDDYKNKYDDLMKRCADFMQDVATPSSYELGYKAGWEAAKQEFHKDNTYVPDTTKPATTMDLQWPRDKMAWPWPPTTTPFPQSIRCPICGIGGDINKAMAYVCNHPQCPTRVTCVSTTGTAT